MTYTGTAAWRDIFTNEVMVSCSHGVWQHKEQSSYVIEWRHWCLCVYSKHLKSTANETWHRPWSWPYHLSLCFRDQRVIIRCQNQFWLTKSSCRFWDIQCRYISPPRPWNPGQGSIKVIESGTIRYTGYGFPLVFYSNFVPKTHRFWYIQRQICRELENRVRVPSSWRCHH